ncbi:hypothetical protein QJQ45_001394 [Haematococcus lacustris]|nr:hypothetical protein QJQ45_001394 [Haematococcus lacustris]
MEMTSTLPCFLHVQPLALPTPAVYHAQPSPAQPSPAQPSPAQPSPAQPSPAQPSPAQPSPAQPSPAQPSPAQPSPAQPSPAQPSPAQPSPAQPSPAQPSPAQPSPAQPSPAQPSPAQPSPAQPSPAQPSPAQPSPQGCEVNVNDKRACGYHAAPGLAKTRLDAHRMLTEQAVADRGLPASNRAYEVTPAVLLGKEANSEQLSDSPYDYCAALAVHGAGFSSTIKSVSSSSLLTCDDKGVGAGAGSQFLFTDVDVYYTAESAANPSGACHASIMIVLGILAWQIAVVAVVVVVLLLVVLVVAGGRMYTIHSAANASLCLSFTSQHTSSSSSSSGQPLQLQPCQFIELQTSTGALQVFKVVRRCSNEYMLQLWSGTEPSNSLSSPLATVYQPTPDHACMAWSPETGLAVQMPCSSERSQRWELAGQPPPTMQLCPPQPAATFFATSPYAVVATLTQLLGCPTACQQAWGAAAAAVAASGGPPPEPQAPLPSCFTVGILELFTYDGEFQQMFWSRGKRDPIRYSHASAPQLLTALAYIWGPPGRGMVRVGTPLQLWLRALDAVLLQPASIMSTPITLTPAPSPPVAPPPSPGPPSPPSPLPPSPSPSPSPAPPPPSPPSSATSWPWSLLGALDHLALICTPSKPNGTLAPARLPPGLLSVFTSGLRNLTLKGCGLRGGLPPDWATVGPLAVTTYVNRYPSVPGLVLVKLETRIPSDFLSGLAALVPAVSGLNLEAVLERAMRERIGGDTATPLASFPTGSGDLIQVLGVSKTASQAEIKKAYFQLCLKLHPDKNRNDEEAKSKFQALQKVHGILGDPEK